MNSKEEFIRKVREQEWDINPEDLIQFVEPAIIHRHCIYEDNEVPLGASKIQGKPDLPIEMIWPEYNGMPMVFIAQINFSDVELAEADVNKIFPEIGILYLFCYYESPPSSYEFSPSKSKYAVIYKENFDELLSRDFPDQLPEAYCFEASSPICFQLDWELPAWDDDHLIDHLSEKDEEILNDLNDDGFRYCKLLGYPRSLQNSVNYSWASEHLGGVYLGDFSSHEQKELLKEFVNLFSFDMEPEGFGVIGHSTAYFGIKKDDLKLRKFEESIFIMQDT